MEKILTIDGKQVAFKSTGAFLLRYKAQFGRDPLQDIYQLQLAADNKDEINTEIIFNLIWTLAKTADNSIPPPLEWLDQFDVFPLAVIAPEVVEMISNSLGSTVKPKKK